MQEILFATTNQNKLKEAKSILGFDVGSISLDLDEIQSLDPLKVVERKAKDYFEKIKKPLFVDDTSLEIEALNGLPGTYMNDFCKRLGNKGILELIKDSTNRRAKASVYIAYIDSTTLKVFEGIIEGAISLSEKGDNGFGWDPIFIPNGSGKTFAELLDVEKEQYSMRTIALKKLKKFLQTS